MKIIRLVGWRIRVAVSTRPDRKGWFNVLLHLCWLVPAILLCGFLGGFLDFESSFDTSGLLALAGVAFFAPALGEELLFRAMLLPREEEGSATLASILSVVLFVLWHPFQALIFGVEAVPIFIDPWFLCAVAALGIALANIYRRTGSIWPCVLLHWFIVLAWKAFFGGPPSPFS